MIDERSSTDRWPQRLPLALIGANYEYWTLGMLISGHLSDSLGTSGRNQARVILISWILLVILGYGLISYVLVRDINKARKVYKFNYVRMVRWTVRQPNGRFTRNSANVWDIATIGSKL